MVAGAVAALSEILGELQRAAGATERLVELLNLRDFVKDPLKVKEFTVPVRGELNLIQLTFGTRPGLIPPRYPNSILRLNLVKQ